MKPAIDGLVASATRVDERLRAPMGGRPAGDDDTPEAGATVAPDDDEADVIVV